MPRQVPSALLGRRWSVPGVGSISLRHVTQAHLSEIDALWPQSRRADDWHHSWRWKDILKRRPESFVVTAVDGAVAGIWCSAKKRPIRLPAGSFYRPDYMEVAPARRTSGLGVFLFALIAARALELNADGVVLGTWPVLRAFYRGLGGTEGKPQGWNLERDLVPFFFDSSRLKGLRAELQNLEENV